jgi:thymidylate synthase (FAD)
VIQPWEAASEKLTEIWTAAMDNAEKSYFEMLFNGVDAQTARSVLPNSLKTEIVASMNFREWKHVFSLRTSKAAHPMIRSLILPLYDHLHSVIPQVF